MDLEVPIDAELISHQAFDRQGKALFTKEVCSLLSYFQKQFLEKSFNL